MKYQYQQIGNGTFYLGDCFDVMAQPLLLAKTQTGVGFASNKMKFTPQKLLNVSKRMLSD